eukprot:749612-Hanusia_phi.AAC.3
MAAASALPTPSASRVYFHVTRACSVHGCGALLKVPYGTARSTRGGWGHQAPLRARSPGSLAAERRTGTPIHCV